MSKLTPKASCYWLSIHYTQARSASDCVEAYTKALLSLVINVLHRNHPTSHRIMSKHTQKRGMNQLQAAARTWTSDCVEAYTKALLSLVINVLHRNHPTSHRIMSKHTQKRFCYWLSTHYTQATRSASDCIEAYTKHRWSKKSTCLPPTRSLIRMPVHSQEPRGCYRKTLHAIWNIEMNYVDSIIRSALR